jgi:hypothetical protein
MSPIFDLSVINKTSYNKGMITMLTLVKSRCEQQPKVQGDIPVGMLFNDWYPLVSKSLFRKPAM